MLKRLYLVMSIGLLITSTFYIPYTAGEGNENTKNYVEGRIIVGFEDTKSQEEILQRIINVYSGEVIYRDDKLNAAILQVEKGREIDIINELKNEPDVRYAEPDYLIHANLIPNDPRWEEQWGLSAIKCSEAWDKCIGSKDVIIAIIDTGVDYEHEDLAENIWKNPNEIPDNKKDDDNNGFVDDYTGWDFVNNDNKPMDDNCHGTHCAGIAAGVMNNHIGIAGVAQVKIMPVKVLNYQGLGSISTVARGIEYAADMGADVISMSLGAQQGGQYLEDACQYAWNKGVILVAAAGNDGNSQVDYPARYSTVIAVGAINKNKELCHWSNYGTDLELVAPGSAILSTYLNNGYEIFSGTSMAAPHVAGVAALVKSHHPEYTNQQIRETLWNTAEDLGEPGRDLYYGYGLVDAHKALGGEVQLLPKLKIKIHRIKAQDPIDFEPLPSYLGEWYYIIKVKSGNREENIVNYNGHEKKFLWWYYIEFDSTDDWIVDEEHVFTVYKPTAEIRIKVKEHDIILDDTADISNRSGDGGREFRMFYDLIHDKILSGSDKIEEGTRWKYTSGEFDGSVGEENDEDDAGCWFDITDNYNPPVPDLEASGNLRWSKIKPGETLHGTIYIWNAGIEDPYGWCENNLNWSIVSWPNWGEWKFNPSSGKNLKPSHGKIGIKVTITVPNERGRTFTGNIKVVNDDNPSDYVTIPVSISTKSSINGLLNNPINFQKIMEFFQRLRLNVFINFFKILLSLIFLGTETLNNFSLP